MNERVIIAGSRTVLPTVQQIDDAIGKLALTQQGDPEWDPERWIEVICGRALGADRAGEAWAKAKNKAIHYEPITTELVDRYGKYLAPKMRNRRMAERADRAIVFWDGTSGGTADMVCRMVARNKPVQVIPWPRIATRRNR